MKISDHNSSVNNVTKVTTNDVTSNYPNEILSKIREIHSLFANPKKPLSPN